MGSSLLGPLGDPCVFAGAGRIPFLPLATRGSWIEFLHAARGLIAHAGRGGKRDLDADGALGARLRGELGVVGGGDRLDDGETEAVSARLLRLRQLVLDPGRAVGRPKASPGSLRQFLLRLPEFLLRLPEWTRTLEQGNEWGRGYSPGRWSPELEALYGDWVRNLGQIRGLVFGRPFEQDVDTTRP